MKYIISNSQLNKLKKRIKLTEDMSSDERERYNDKGDAQSYPESNDVNGKVLININNSRNPKDDNFIYVNLEVEVNEEGIADAFLNVEKDIRAGTPQMEAQKVNFIKNYFPKNIRNEERALKQQVIATKKVDRLEKKLLDVL